MQMARHTQTTSDYGDEGFDLGRIFIGREQQLDLFKIYLERWQQRMFNADADEGMVTTAPSPNNKIEGMVVLLYGRGGFGKSTLLRRFREMVLADNQKLLPGQSVVTVSAIVDWEFAVEGKRGLFNPPAGQEMDAGAYFQALCGQLAIALDKPPKAFKEYLAAVRDVEEARKKAAGVLDSLKSNDRYAAVRDMTVGGVMTAISIGAPGPVSKIVGSEKVQGAASQGVKLAGDLLTNIKQRLQDRLGERYGDFLEPALRLGLALGKDLHDLAQNFPLLILFDTYEEIDEGDRLLRMAMKAAGERVGWIVAGRDNLWAGPGQPERSVALEYGYKEIVPTDRGLAIDFNAGGVGAFTVSDIKDYFDLLWKQVEHDLQLAKVNEEGAKRILDVTGGVPLAVKIAAGLYIDTGDLDMVTETVEGKRAIVDQMVRRYLLHARDNEVERGRLNGLAMLRRSDQPMAVAAALGLSAEEAATSYADALSRLHRRYSFIFTEKEEPALHQEVRHFLRLWLLEHRKEPEIVAVNGRLKTAHEDVLKKLEESRQYGSLQERMQDEEWTGIYLDLTEQQFWLDPFDGVRCILPFMIAAAIYQRNINKDAVKVGEFFEGIMRSPYRIWWSWTAQSLMRTSSRHASPNELAGLEELEKLVDQHRCPTFSPPLPNYREELEAALWWRLGEAYQREDDRKALEWYEKALKRLEQQDELKKAAAEAAWYVSDTLDREKKYAESIVLLNRAIELNANYVLAYKSRGNVRYELKEYWRAIQDYDRVLKFDPNDVSAYTIRGLSYYCLKEYQLAIADYDRVLELDPNYTIAHTIRGDAYLWMRNVIQAVDDFSSRYVLGPTNAYAGWMREWAGMGKQRADVETATRLEAVAASDPQCYEACVCRGVVAGLRGKLKEGLEEVEKAISLEPEAWDAYFWKGMLMAYYYGGQNHLEEARAMIEKALKLEMPPVLLTPLYWLEKDRPEFFEKYARPLLEQYGV
jgi:tetratricopeptide (TPR) repeat protein